MQDLAPLSARPDTALGVRLLIRLIWGADVDRALEPLLLTAFAGTLSASAAFPFFGIWALKHLGASQGQLSVAFLLAALTAIAAGYLGGHLSDHVGRRPVLLAAWTAATVAPLGLIAAGHRVVAGLAVMASFNVVGAIFSATQYAMVADLVAPERREAGYAAVRV